MIIKLSKVISCSSEHPQYPATNLLEYPSKSSWRCAKPNQLVATVHLQLSESSCITGLEIGNYRSCIVVIEASTLEESDKWIPIVNHQFLSHDEAANNKFKDQVQLFTKRDLNVQTVLKKFDRIKITCMQSANPRELFGLEFIIFKTEVVVDIGLDVFGCFKLKKENKITDEFKEKYLNLFCHKTNNKKDLPGTTKNLIPHSNLSKKQDDSVTRPLFEDIVSYYKNDKVLDKRKLKNIDTIPSIRSCSPSNTEVPQNMSCKLCNSNTDLLCLSCNLLSQPKQLVSRIQKKRMTITKPKKEFNKLFSDVSFALSGYINPQRDAIRSKALKMGAKYNANPNKDNKCTHLICAFQNTPKLQQLRGYCKIVNHNFIEDAYNKKKRFPWRRYALDSQEKNQVESEAEVEGSLTPIISLTLYNQATDDSDFDE